jgi:hypothetical protein
MGVVGTMVGSTGVALADDLGIDPSDATGAVTNLTENGLAADTDTDTDVSGAGASVVDADALGEELAGAARSEAAFPSNPGPNRAGLDVSALGGTASVSIGDVEVPLDGVIDFGQLGALYSESTATDELTTEAISGLLSGDGSVTLDGEDGDFGAAEINLLSLFDTAGVESLTESVIDQATLRVGAGGAHVVTEDGVFVDQDGVGGPGQYRVGEVSALAHSPLIEQAAGQLYDAIGTYEEQLVGKVNDLIDATAITGSLPAGVDLSRTWVESDIQDEVFAAILAEPITTKNKFLTIDLSKGTATFHLDQLLSGELRPGQPTGLNAQNPNTELIDDEIYPMIAESVHDAMNEATSIALGAVEGALESVTIHFVADISTPLVGDASATWDVNLMSGDLTNVTCEGSGIVGGLGCTAIVTAVNTLGPAVETALVPARDFVLGNGGQQLFDTLIGDIKTGAITVPIRQALEPFIEQLTQVVSVQLNHQVTEVCTAGDGSERISGLEVSALSVGFAQAVDGARVNFGNAGAQVDACGE